MRILTQSLNRRILLDLESFGAAHFPGNRNLRKQARYVMSHCRKRNWNARSQRLYLSLGLAVGYDPLAAGPPWMREALEDTSVSDPNQRVERLYSEVIVRLRQRQAGARARREFAAKELGC